MLCVHNTKIKIDAPTLTLSIKILHVIYLRTSFVSHFSTCQMIYKICILRKLIISY